MNNINRNQGILAAFYYLAKKHPKKYKIVVNGAYSVSFQKYSHYDFFAGRIYYEIEVVKFSRPELISSESTSTYQQWYNYYLKEGVIK